VTKLRPGLQTMTLASVMRIQAGLAVGVGGVTVG